MIGCATCSETGYSRSCAPCTKAYKREHDRRSYHKNIEKIKERRIAWSSANKEKIKQYRLNAKNDPGHIIACKKCGEQKYSRIRCKNCNRLYMAKSYSEDGEKFRKRSRERREKFPEITKAQKSDSWKKNQKYFQEKAKEWGRKNRHRTQVYTSSCRAKRRLAPGIFTAEEWVGIMYSQNGMCFDCGEARNLSIGHMIPLSRGGRDSSENIVAQCMDCNRKQGTRLHWAAVAP